MPQKPTIKQLKYLCKLADHRHFGHAAQACHVTQSTLSAGIHELEDALGVKLFERNNKQVLLTCIGEATVERARHILNQLDDLMTEASSSKEPLGGELRLGVIPTIAPFLLPRVLPHLRKKYPRLQLYIREDLSDHLLKALNQGQLDVLLFALPYPTGNHPTMHLFNDSFLAAYPENYPLAKKKTLHIKDMENEELLLLEDGHCLREHALQACQLEDAQINIPYQATSLHTIVQMVANGLGITLLPEMAIASKILSGTRIKTRAFKEENVARSIGLVWRKNCPRENEFRLLGDYIRSDVEQRLNVLK